MTVTHWTLARTLQQRGITPHALIKATGLSKSTVYDIVNGKSQAITLETVDKLLDGLEQLTGQRMPLGAVLDRTEPEDPYAHLFANARTYEPEEVRHLIPAWTPEEKVELSRHWDAIEEERRARQVRPDKRTRQLEAILADESKPGTEQGRPA